MFVNVNLFHLSFILPCFIVLINFLLGRLYIFFLKNREIVFCSNILVDESDCESKLELVVRSYYS